MLDLDKVNRHQIDELDPHEDLDNTDDAPSAENTADVKMRVQQAPAQEPPHPEVPEAASPGYSPGTPIEEDLVVEDVTRSATA